MSFGNHVVLKADNAADADHSASGVLGMVSMGDRGVLRLTLDVTKAGGTPTLDVTIETSETQGGPWRSLGTFTQATAIGSERKSFAGADRYARARATIGGSSPALRFTIAGDAV